MASSTKTKGTGRNSGVYFTVDDLRILALLKKRYGLDQSSVLRLAIRKLLKYADLEVA